jgi:hypothetical protein
MLVARYFRWVRSAERIAGFLIGQQQFRDAGTQTAMGPTGLIEGARQCVGPFVVEAFEKDRLGIGIDVVHG